MPTHSGHQLTLTLVSILWSCHALGAASADESRREIDQLIAYLETSECEFNRNGERHSPRAAGKHLRRKRKHIERELASLSAEDFIESAASKSSMTGQAYQVRCPGTPVALSADWFGAELLRLRAEASAAD